MKFKSFNLDAGKSIFAEVMVGRDRTSFEQAYAKNVHPHLLAKRADTRQWVISIISVFADKINVSFAQAKQMVETGNSLAIIAIHKKRAAELHAQLLKLDNESLQYNILHAELQTYVKTVEMSDNDVSNMLRMHWGWALTMRHPAAKIDKKDLGSGSNVFTPKSQVKSNAEVVTKKTRAA